MSGRTGRTRVVVFDDREFTRRGTAAVLAALPGIRVAGEAADLDAVTSLAEAGADVVLLPVRLCAAVCERWTASSDPRPAARLVVVAEDPSSPELAAALRFGVAGYLLADSPVAEYAAALTGARDGVAHVSTGLTPILLRELARDGSDTPLTGRERQVLQLMADGSSNRGIADRLFISENTVKNHVRHILEKTGTRSRMAAVARALRDGLVEIG